MDEWLEGRITGKRHWTDRLFTLRVAAAIDRFTPGQFVRVALDISGERVARPYSCVNLPDEPNLEIYYNTVDGSAQPRCRRQAMGSTPGQWLLHPW